MMWDGFGGMGWGWIGLGMVHMLLFWVLVVLGIVVLTRWLAGGPRDQVLPRAIAILKARYAKGEITREQFEEMKRDIGEPSARWSSVPRLRRVNRQCAVRHHLRNDFLGDLPGHGLTLPFRNVIHE